jgi:hypothetical protein
MTNAPRQGERGFALLIVFLMAAAIALMLYRQIPRVGFESQRDKEETLIERGSQYKRAIQLYFITFKKYPSKIEDLENTNNQRFLRRRFIDPMTGKDEWRLVHVNGAGQLTDSQVEKPPAPADEKQTAANGTTPATATTTTAPNANPPAGSAADTPQEVNAAVLRRPSDRPLTPAGSIPGSGGIAPGTDPNDPRNWPPIFLTPANANQPGANPQGFTPQFPGQQFPGQQFPGQQFPGQQPGQPTVQGQQFPGQQFPGQPFPGQQFPGQQFPGQQFPGQTPGQQDPSQVSGAQPGAVQPVIPGQIVPGQFPVTLPGLPGQPSNPNQTAVDPQNPNQNSGQFPQPAIPNQTGINPPRPTFQPQPGLPAQTGVVPTPNGQGTVPNPALNMINDLLRTPRQAPNAPTTAANNPLNAGGLAGVASTFSGPSIKVYRERSKYNEWEFIFDMKQGLPGQPANNQQQPQNGKQNPANPNQPNSPNPPSSLFQQQK